MGDAGFAWFQFQPHSLQPLCGHFLTLLDDFPVRVQNHKIIGEPDDLGRAKAPASASGELFVCLSIEK